LAIASRLAIGYFWTSRQARTGPWPIPWRIALRAGKSDGISGLGRLVVDDYACRKTPEELAIDLAGVSSGRTAKRRLLTNPFSVVWIKMGWLDSWSGWNKFKRLGEESWRKPS